jgi:hypothetical protein
LEGQRPLVKLIVHTFDESESQSIQSVYQIRQQRLALPILTMSFFDDLPFAPVNECRPRLLNILEKGGTAILLISGKPDIFFILLPCIVRLRAL